MEAANSYGECFEPFSDTKKTTTLLYERRIYPAPFKRYAFQQKLDGGNKIKVITNEASCFYVFSLSSQTISHHQHSSLWGLYNSSSFNQLNKIILQNCSVTKHTLINCISANDHVKKHIYKNDNKYIDDNVQSVPTKLILLISSPNPFILDIFLLRLSRQHPVSTQYWWISFSSSAKTDVSMCVPESIAYVLLST